jgi:hypothetical protein
VTTPEQRLALNNKVLEALRERMACGVGPVFARYAIRILAIVEIPLWVTDAEAEGKRIMLDLEKTGLVYRVSAHHTTILPAYWPEPWMWAPVGSTLRGQTLPPYEPTKEER